MKRRAPTDPIDPLRDMTAAQAIGTALLLGAIGLLFAVAGN